MLRDKSLIPLSHQHQHVLSMCVRIDRALQAGVIDLEAWQAEIAQIYSQEIGVHFEAEETVLFPAARRCEGLATLVDELVREHIVLREYFVQASVGSMSLGDLKAFGESLAGHVRKEERQLFEGMQSAIGAEELATLGAALEKALANASKACVLPTRATRVRSRAAMKA
jgi:hemerythrin-like domain-containing protein